MFLFVFLKAAAAHVSRDGGTGRSFHTHIYKAEKRVTIEQTHTRHKLAHTFLAQAKIEQLRHFVREMGRS